MCKILYYLVLLIVLIQNYIVYCFQNTRPCWSLLHNRKLVVNSNIKIKNAKLYNDKDNSIGLDASDVSKANSKSQLYSILSSNNNEFDYVIIGSGIGGLSAGAMLSYYGYSVLVLESHYLCGGVAHSFERNGFSFDAGPSLWNGMATKPYNPLREVLEIVGEGDNVKYAQYDGWVMHIPEGSFKFQVGEGNFEPVILKFGGSKALQEWNQLNNRLKDITELSCAIPPLCLRNDAGIFLTLFPHLWKLIKGLPAVPFVEGSFKTISEPIITKDSFLDNWFEFLSFALSGLPADGTIAAAVAYTMRDLHQKGAALDYPIGGSGAVVDALIRAIQKYKKGHVVTNSHVQEITIENGKASGVKLRGGKRVKAKRAVISNASIWDTIRLLPENTLPKEEYEKKDDTPMTGSFVHLHLGIDATGLPDDLESHYSVINQWDDIDAPQNHVIISIPSVLDPSLAPPNCHVIHAYAAANEPYDLYDFKNNKSNAPKSKEEYDSFKKERCEFLWEAIERSIPDVRSRVKVELPGSPITHARFNRRFKGTYGPALRAGEEKFPYPKTDIPGLYCCGDSVFPGIGVPAVAASGANAASSTVSVWEQLDMLNKLYKI